MSNLYDSNKHKKLIISKALSSDSSFYPDSSDKYKPSKYFLNNLYSTKDTTKFDIAVPFAAVKRRNYDDKIVYSANVNFGAYSDSIGDSGPHWINRNSLYDLMNQYGFYSAIYTPELDMYNWHNLQINITTSTVTGGTGGGGPIAAYNYPIAITQKDKTQYHIYPPVKVSNTDVIVTADEGTEHTDICVSANHSFSFRLGYEGIISGVGLDNYMTTEKPKWQQWCVVSIKGGFTTGHACNDSTDANRTFKYVSIIEEMNNFVKEKNYNNLCMTDIRRLKKDVYYVSDMNYNTYTANNQTYLSQPSFMSGGEATLCNNGAPVGYTVYYTQDGYNWCYTGSSAHYEDNCWVKDDNKDYIITKNYYDGTNNYLTGTQPTINNGWSTEPLLLNKLTNETASTLVNSLNNARPTEADYRFSYHYQPSKRTLMKTNADASNIISEYHDQVPAGQTHLSLSVNYEQYYPTTSLAKNYFYIPLPEVRWLALNYYIKIL